MSLKSTILVEFFWAKFLKIFSLALSNIYERCWTPFLNPRTSVVFNEGIKGIKTIAKVIMKLPNNKTFIHGGKTNIAALITMKQSMQLKKAVFSHSIQVTH